MLGNKKMQICWCLHKKIMFKKMSNRSSFKVWKKKKMLPKNVELVRHIEELIHQILEKIFVKQEQQNVFGKDQL